MYDFLAFVGALSVGCTFVVILLVILGGMHERDDRRARDRELESVEAVEHIRRFSAAMQVIDLAEYRARKANAPATGSRPSLDASRSVAEAASPRAEGILTAGGKSNV